MTQFPGQKQGEVLHFIIRKHWIVYLRIALFFVLALLAPVVLYQGLVWGGLHLEAEVRQWGLLLFLIHADIILLRTMIRWIEEEIDLVLVTGERLISIEQIAFLHRTITETELSEVQDVKGESMGLLAHIFGYGMLEVQTAGEKITFRIESVGNPDDFRRKILDLCHDYKMKLSGHQNGSGAAS